MSTTGKILIAAIVICGAVAGWLISTNQDKPKAPSYPPLAVIESNVLYAASVTSADAPSASDSGPLFGNQQDYHIRLDAGKTYMVETSVGWQDVGVALYENGRRLGEASCGFRARCSFFVDTEKEVWGTLRVKGDAENSQEPLSVEVREVANSFATGHPSSRTGKLIASPLPFIESDGIHSGSLSVSDSPLYWGGGGRVQDYRIQLTAGQRVLINAKSAEAGLGVALFAPDGILGRKFAQEINQAACIDVDVPANGTYILRVMSRDRQNAPTGDYSLDISRAPASGQTCQTE